MVGTKRDMWAAWTWIIVRCFLGGVFLYASLDKIQYPHAFAEAVFNYKLLPTALVNGFSLVLPWLEAVTGLFLILGRLEWVSLTLYNGLLIVYMGAIAISLARGLDIHCGCFSLGLDSAKITRIELLRDIGFLLPGLLSYLLLVRLRRPPFFRPKRAAG